MSSGISCQSWSNLRSGVLFSGKKKRTPDRRLIMIVLCSETHESSGVYCSSCLTSACDSTSQVPHWAPSKTSEIIKLEYQWMPWMPNLFQSNMKHAKTAGNIHTKWISHIIKVYDAWTERSIRLKTKMCTFLRTWGAELLCKQVRSKWLR